MAQVGEILKQEIDGLCQGGGAFTDGPSTRKMLSEFSLFMLSDQFSKPSPHLGNAQEKTYLRMMQMSNCSENMPNMQ